MERCAVLVDAGYLFKAGGSLLASRDCRREELRLDGTMAVTALHEAAVSITKRELLRIYWYDAAARGPTPDHRAIAELPNVKLRLGHLNSAGQQKGVDPLIIMDMLTLARNRACDDIVLLSGDADLVVGVLQSQEYGVRVHLLGLVPTRANQAPLLRQEADTCHEWDLSAISRFLRTATTEELAYREPARKVATQARPALASVTFDSNSAQPSASPVAVGARVDVGISVDASDLAVVTTVRPQAQPPFTLLADTRVTDALLRQVAEAVERDLRPEDREEIVNASRPGTVPGHVDRRLLGTAKSMLQTFLQDAEKRLLRRLLYDVCVQRAEGQSATDLEIQTSHVDGTGAPS